MGSLGGKKRLKISVPVILFIIFICFPSLLWSAGYQEEKLFDGDFYSAEDLGRKIEEYTKEIQVLDQQIKKLETDIDWVVLKINQIQDSGRTASSNLKDSISKFEKKRDALSKNKSRLEYLVQYYTAMLESNKQQQEKDTYRTKFPAVSRKTKINMKDIGSKKSETMSSQALSSGGNDSEIYNGISKTQLQTAINKSGLSDWVEIIGTGTCLRLETTLPILFPTGSAQVAGEYVSFFNKLAEFLRPYDVKVLVTGYADTVPIKNQKYPSNFELGATRAANIVHQLVNSGLNPSIFKIESTGKYRFAAKGMSKQKTLERRAEVTVIFSG